MHESILKYRNARYFWWGVAVSLAATAVYLSQSDLQPPNGGTWQGYVLGGIGAALIVWLTALGIVKRSYGRSNIQAWTSAHVYLGLALFVVATLHGAGQLGWNVHTLSYVFMCVVIVSGIVGLSFYLRYPALLVRNSPNATRRQMFAELSRLNDEGEALANRCHVNVRTSVDTAITRTSIGGNLFDQLFARDTSTVMLLVEGKGSDRSLQPVSNRDQAAIIDYVAKCIPRTRKQGESETLQELLDVLCRRQTVTRQIREDIKLHSRLKVWLWIHIPLTMATLITLIIHIVSVFFYW